MITNKKEENLIKLMIEVVMFSSKNKNRWLYVLTDYKNKTPNYENDKFEKVIQDYYNHAVEFDDMVDRFKRENTKLLEEKIKFEKNNEIKIFNKNKKSYNKNDLEQHSYCWGEIDVLSNLIGLEWDETSLMYVSALRPSIIYVSTGEITCDCAPWRVHVIIDENNIIKSITQEVVFNTFGASINGGQIYHLLKIKKEEQSKNNKE